MSSRLFGKIALFSSSAGRRIAATVGVAHVEAGLSPDAKRQVLHRLQTTQGMVGMVGMAAMVGDRAQ